MPSTEPRGPKQIYKALIWSLKGLRAGWTFEASFRLEVYLFCLFGPLGLLAFALVRGIRRSTIPSTTGVAP